MIRDEFRRNFRPVTPGMLLVMTPFVLLIGSIGLFSGYLILKAMLYPS
jgi:hypothetical protein